MSLRFDGRVAIVTGAGNGLGRSYALALASKGCKVVVNDLGGGKDGTGSSRAADVVVDEIRKAGGEAVANYNSVEDGEQIVQTAIDAYGKVDIVINNAGILRDQSFVKMTDNDWDLIYRVHLRGTYKVTKAAWPYMRENRFGRVVNVASAAGLYGNFGQANYGAMKMAVIGMANTLAREGAKYDIKVNCIAPIAGSRLTATVMPPDLVEALRPELVVPVVEWLAHEGMEESGAVFELGGGWVSKLRWQRSEGVAFSGDYTMENVKHRWNDIVDFSTGVSYPTSTQDAFEPIMKNLENAATAAAATGGGGAAGAGAGSQSQLRSAAVFDMIGQAAAAQGPALVKKVKGTIRFNITPGGVWLLNLKTGSGSVTEGDTTSKADVTITVADEDFVALSQNKLNPQQAFMKGKIKVKGNMGLAMKLDTVMKAARQAAGI